jgi:hypothetical protein
MLPNGGGRWMISVEDFKALGYDAKTWKDKLALPAEPNSWSLVKVPKSTTMRDGTAGEIWQDGFYWGHGGVKQFEIVDWNKLDNNLKFSWFKKGGNF